MVIGKIAGTPASVSTFFNINVVDDCSNAQLNAQDVTPVNYEVGSSSISINSP